MVYTQRLSEQDPTPVHGWKNQIILPQEYFQPLWEVAPHWQQQQDLRRAEPLLGLLHRWTCSVDPTPEVRRQRAELAYRLGECLLNAGQYGEGRGVLSEAIDLASDAEVGIEWVRVEGAHLLGVAAYGQRCFAESWEWLEQAEAGYARRADPWCNLGHVKRDQAICLLSTSEADPRVVDRLLRESIQLTDQADRPGVSGLTRFIQASWLARRGQYEAAWDIARDTDAAVGPSEPVSNLARRAFVFALIAACSGEDRLAEEELRQGRRVCEEYGLPSHLEQLSRLAGLLDRPLPARLAAASSVPGP
jgi:hypothetical protein